MKRKAVIIIVMVLAAGLVGWAAGYTVDANRTGRFEPGVKFQNKTIVLEIVDSKSHHYVYPQSVQNARSECFRQEREARGIPGGDAYIVWWEANKGTPAQTEWSAAYQACKDRHDVSGVKWSEEWYGNLVYLGHY